MSKRYRIVKLTLLNGPDWYRAERKTIFGRWVPLLYHPSSVLNISVWEKTEAEAQEDLCEYLHKKYRRKIVLSEYEI